MVPRQCPLVLLVEVTHMLGINFYMTLEGLHYNDTQSRKYSFLLSPFPSCSVSHYLITSFFSLLVAHHLKKMSTPELLTTEHAVREYLYCCMHCCVRRHRRGQSRNHSFPASPLVRVRNLLPSNWRCLQSYCIATGIHATIL
jgi:hypothetical protein